MTDNSQIYCSNGISTADNALSCEEFLHSILRNANTISFRDYMEIALYHPNGGYYSTTEKRVGKDGDFFTSVSVGACFGKIIAHRIISLWQEMGQPPEFDLIELGANDASLCVDILTELAAKQPSVHFHYHIVEPLAALRDIQIKKLSSLHIANVSHYTCLDEVQNKIGIFLSNELIDAFPVELITFTDKQWKQVRVGLTDGQFSEEFVSLEENSELAHFATSLGCDFPENYRTEFRPKLNNFISQINGALAKGIVLTIDYGFPRSHYYHKSRSEGSIQTYFKHQKDDLPLQRPGEKDITSHIDFTQYAEASIQAGFELYDFSPQHRYLTHYGKDWLTTLEENFSPAMMPFIKQFQTLTHPGMMGQQFHMLEMTKGLSIAATPTTQKPEEVLELNSY